MINTRAFSKTLFGSQIYKDLTFTGVITILGTLVVSTFNIITSTVQNLIVTGTTDATSLTTGSITTLGGASIGKTLYTNGLIVFTAGGDGAFIVRNQTTGAKAATSMRFSGNSVSDDLEFAVTPGNLNYVQNGGGSTINAGDGVIDHRQLTGQIHFTVGTQGSSTVPIFTLTNTEPKLRTNSQYKIYDTTTSTSKTTGCFQAAGGAGIAGPVFCGPVTADSFTSVSITNNTASTSTTTGAFQCAGGAGIQGTAHLGGLAFGASTTIMQTFETSGITTMTFSGPWASPQTVNVQYFRMGYFVRMFITGFNATSTVANQIITSGTIPAPYTNNNTVNGTVTVQNAAQGYNSSATVVVGSVLQIYNGPIQTVSTPVFPTSQPVGLLGCIVEWIAATG